MAVSKERIGEIIEYSIENSEEKACEAYSIPMETFNRYKREYKKYFGENAELFLDLRNRFSKEELQALAKKKSILPEENVSTIDFSGTDIVFGVMGDTHIGSQYTDENFIASAIEEFKKQKCEFVVHAGDVTEGMSGRDGHVFELTHIGYKEQKKAAIELLSRWEKKWFMIAGNHDLWYMKKGDIGADIVEDICSHLKDAVYLGPHEGDIVLNGATIRLWHGEDGSSFAHSYRIQHLLGSFSASEVPDVLLTGHCHKHGYFYERECHALSMGAMQKQSGFMRYKRLPSHTGFCIVRMTVQDGKVVSFAPTFYPYKE